MRKISDLTVAECELILISDGFTQSQYRAVALRKWALLHGKA